MGNAVAKRLIAELPTTSYRYVLRKIRRFNAIPRAEKKIETFINDKPERAPLPEAMRKSINSELERDSDVLLKFSEKHQALNSNLKKVYVTSEGSNKDGFSVKRATQVMPQERTTEVPKGKYTLKAAVGFIGAHKENPKEFSVEALAHLYNMDFEKMNNILTHIKPFKVLLPEKTKRKPWYEKLKDDASPTLVVTENVEQELLQYYHTRSTQFSQFRSEKLKLPKDDLHPYLNYDSKSGIPSMSVSKFVASKIRVLDKLEKLRSPDEVERKEISRQLSPDYNPGLEKPEDDKFDVFKEIEKKDSKKTPDKSSDQNLKRKDIL